MTNDILVFVEQRNDKALPAALQCFTAAKQLAAKTGGKLIAGVIGDKVDQTAAAAEQAGAAQIVTVTDAALANYSALRYRTALAAIVKKTDPRAVLLATTFMGRDLGARLAAHVRGAVAVDVIELAVADDGALDVKRPLYNGKATCRVKMPADRVAVVSIRPNTFPVPEGAGGGAARESLPYAPATGDDRITVKEVIKAGGEVKDVTEADIIVSGGRSLKSEENFKMLFDLAKELDAAVGASRAACDAGYQPHSRQVGLTGKTVTPRLYFAFGISGAIQHLAGMRGSKTIVAVNTDPEAPMFKIADYGIVGDLFKIVPLLTEEVKNLK